MQCLRVKLHKQAAKYFLLCAYYGYGTGLVFSIWQKLWRIHFNAIVDCFVAIISDKNSFRCYVSCRCNLFLVTVSCLLHYANVYAIACTLLKNRWVQSMQKLNIY